MRSPRPSPGSTNPAVGGLTLTVPEGELIALVGPSGCGKTTTLKMINRLDRADRGQHRGARRRRRATCRCTSCAGGIGYVIQQIGPVPAPHDRRQHRHRARSCSAGTRPAPRARVDELAELVGLDPEHLRSLPGGPLGRPAAAGRRGPGPGRRPADPADGRALPRRRPHRAGPAPGRAARPAGRGPARRSCSSPTTSTRPSSSATGSPSSTSAACSSSAGPPEELLRNPANDFVVDFLGRERGLKRLALLTVRDASWSTGPVVRRRRRRRRRPAVMAEHHVDWVGVLDGRRLLGWVVGPRPRTARTMGQADLRPFAARRHAGHHPAGGARRHRATAAPGWPSCGRRRPLPGHAHHRADRRRPRGLTVLLAADRTRSSGGLDLRVHTTAA